MTDISTYFELYTWQSDDGSKVGYIFAPVSHNIFRHTHVLKNVVYFIFACALLEPHLEKRIKIPIIFVFSGLVVYTLTNTLSDYTIFRHVVVGSSCSVFAFWSYGGIKTYYSLKDASPLTKQQHVFKIQKVLSYALIFSAFIIGVYELAFSRHLCHYLSILVGLFILVLEEHIPV